MADAAVIETLLIKIGADIIDLKRGVNDANKNLEGLDKTTKNTAKNMTASFVAMVRGLLPVISVVAAVSTAIKAMQQAVANTQALDQLSQATGISVQRLSELRNAALATGVDFQSLSQALTQFGPRMTEALANPASRGSQALRALGIDVRDAGGNLRSLDELLPQFADKFSSFTDGSNKAALAVALFGEEAGPKLIPLLNKGRAGLQELNRSLGATVTQQDADRVRQFQETIGKLQIAFEKFSQELVVRIGPAIIAILDRTREGAVKLIEEWNNVRLNMLQEAAKKSAEEIDKLGKEMVDLVAERERLFGLGEPFEHLTPRIVALQDEITRLADQIRAVNAEMGFLGEQQGQHLLPARPAPQMDPEAIEKAQFQLDQLMEKLQGSRTILDEMNFAWADHSDRVAMAVEKINAVYGEGFKRERAIAQARHQINMKEQEDILSTASLAASTLTQLFGKNKLAAIGTATINTAVGITRALSTLSPPWSWIQAGLIAAAGAAQIASIRSATEQGGGGNPSVGSGGASATGAAGEEQVNRSITVQGIDRNALFSGGQMAGLIDLLNEETKRGSTLLATNIRPT